MGIKPEDLPEMKGESVVRTAKELKSFFNSLRQDWYSEEQIQEYVGLNLSQELLTWKSLNSELDSENATFFFSIHNEADNQGMNDNWGKYTLFRCAALRTNDGHVHVLKDKIAHFAH